MRLIDDEPAPLQAPRSARHRTNTVADEESLWRQEARDRWVESEAAAVAHEEGRR